MSEETDKRLTMAFVDLEHAVKEFDQQTRVPLRGYTIKQPYAKSIRARMIFIEQKLKEEFEEIRYNLEPDQK